jgi:hypothetical protein
MPIARTQHDGIRRDRVSRPGQYKWLPAGRLWVFALWFGALAQGACVGRVHDIHGIRLRATGSASHDAAVSVAEATAASDGGAAVPRDAGAVGKSTTSTSLDAGRTSSPAQKDAAPRDAAAGPADSSPPIGTGTSALDTRIKTVFLVLLENKTWTELQDNSDAAFLNDKLIPAAAIAPNYKGAKGGKLHPSEPNLLWLEAGDNLGITDDSDPAQNHQATTAHLVTLLEQAGVSWKSYQEDIAGDVCPLKSVKQYVPRHNPAVFFDDVTNKNDPKSAHCISHVRPLTELAQDLKTGNVARYNFVTPNLCNDMHSECAPQKNEIKQGDDWLSQWMPQLLASDAYKTDGAIFIVWDEAEEDSTDCPGADCPMGLIVLSPLAKPGYVSQIAYDHSSTLKTMQLIFGVTPLLRGAADPAVHDLSDLFTSFP